MNHYSVSRDKRCPLYVFLSGYLSSMIYAIDWCLYVSFYKYFSCVGFIWCYKLPILVFMITYTCHLWVNVMICCAFSVAISSIWLFVIEQCYFSCVWFLGGSKNYLYWCFMGSLRLFSPVWCFLVTQKLPILALLWGPVVVCIGDVSYRRYPSRVFPGITLFLLCGVN